MSFGQALPYGGVINSQLLLSAASLNRKSPPSSISRQDPTASHIVATPPSMSTVSGHSAGGSPSDMSVETLRLLAASYGLPPHLMAAAAAAGNPASLDQFRAFPHGLTLGFYPTLNAMPSAGQLEMKNAGDSTCLQGVLSQQTQTLPAYYLDPALTASYQYATDRFANPLDLNAARRKNATRETTAALKAWLYEHRKNPYPTKGEKIMLAIITKMSLTQVSTWFANARRRLKKENKMTWSPRNRSEEDDEMTARQTVDGAGSDVSALEEALNRPDSSTSALGDGTDPGDEDGDDEVEEEAVVDDDDESDLVDHLIAAPASSEPKAPEHMLGAQDNKESSALGKRATTTTTTDKIPPVRTEQPATKKAKIWSIVEDTVMSDSTPHRSSSGHIVGRAASTTTGSVPPLDMDAALSSFNHWQQLAAANMYPRLPPQLGPIPGVMGYPFATALRPDVFARLPPNAVGSAPVALQADSIRLPVSLSCFGSLSPTVFSRVVASKLQDGSVCSELANGGGVHS